MNFAWVRQESNKEEYCLEVKKIVTKKNVNGNVEVIPFMPKHEKDFVLNKWYFTKYNTNGDVAKRHYSRVSIVHLSATLREIHDKCNSGRKKFISTKGMIPESSFEDNFSQKNSQVEKKLMQKKKVAVSKERAKKILNKVAKEHEVNKFVDDDNNKTSNCQNRLMDPVVRLQSFNWKPTGQNVTASQSTLTSLSNVDSRLAIRPQVPSIDSLENYYPPCPRVLCKSPCQHSSMSRFDELPRKNFKSKQNQSNIDSDTVSRSGITPMQENYSPVPSRSSTESSQSSPLQLSTRKRRRLSSATQSDLPDYEDDRSRSRSRTPIPSGSEDDVPNEIQTLFQRYSPSQDRRESASTSQNRSPLLHQSPSPTQDEQRNRLTEEQEQPRQQQPRQQQPRQGQGRKRLTMKMTEWILSCIQYYENRDGPGYNDRAHRYQVQNDQIYLGEQIFVEALRWHFLQLRIPSIFLIDLACIIWTPEELCNRALDLSKVVNNIPGRSPVKLIEKERLRLLISLYSEYLIKKDYTTADRVKYLLKATYVLRHKIRDLRAEQIRLRNQNQPRNPRRRLRYNLKE